MISFQTFNSNRHCVFVGVELFGGCHQFNGVTDAVDAVSGEMLEGDLAAVAVEIHTAIGCSVAVSRQGVIGAAGIVARTLTGIFA